MTGAYLLLLGTLFLTAATAKLQDRPGFIKALTRLVRESFAVPASVFIPAIEGGLGMLLVCGIAARPSLAAAILLLLLFTIVLAQMWRGGVKTCGCFGDNETSASPASGIVRNLLLISGGLIVLLYGKNFTVFEPSLVLVIGRTTVAAGTICLWLGVHALIKRRKFLLPTR